MGEKEFGLLSRGLMILYEGICEKHGVDIIGLNARMVEDTEEDSSTDDLAS